MGYHRLHTHRSYQVPKVLEYFFAVCGTLALQGGPVFWAACHRIHHQYSDHDGDPHTPRDGRWWAHMLWTMFGEPLHANTEVMGKYAPDLTKDRFYRALSSYHWVPLVALGLTLLALGGFPVASLGHLRASRFWAALHVVGQLGDPLVGVSTFRHDRRFAKFVVGCAANLW